MKRTCQQTYIHTYIQIIAAVYFEMGRENDSVTREIATWQTLILDTS